MYPVEAFNRPTYAAGMTLRVKRSVAICFCMFVLILAEGSLQAQVDSSGWIRAGNGNDTIAMTSHNSLFTIEKGGALYRIDPTTGMRRQTGKAEFANTKFLFGQSGYLYTIETDGSLYRISPVDGSWVLVGQAGSWKNTIALFPMIPTLLYSVESNGALYKTDLTKVRWVQLGKPEFANTRFIFGRDQYLYTIESDGSLYRVNPRNGRWRGLGRAGEWKGTVLATSFKTRIYTVEQNGALYETDMGTGAWKQIGKPEFAKAKFMSWLDDSLYILEDDGLYRVNPTTGIRTAVGK
jgi:hypothetical protein